MRIKFEDSIFEVSSFHALNSGELVFQLEKGGSLLFSPKERGTANEDIRTLMADLFTSGKAELYSYKWEFSGHHSFGPLSNFMGAGDATTYETYKERYFNGGIQNSDEIKRHF